MLNAKCVYAEPRCSEVLQYNMGVGSRNASQSIKCLASNSASVFVPSVNVYCCQKFQDCHISYTTLEQWCHDPQFEKIDFRRYSTSGKPCLNTARKCQLL